MGNYFLKNWKSILYVVICLNIIKYLSKYIVYTIENFAQFDSSEKNWIISVVSTSLVLNIITLVFYFFPKLKNFISNGAKL